MNPQVTVALISGGAALAVALLGIAGAIAAQLVATRRGFASSLALLERQLAQSFALAEQERADKERERQEGLHREDAHRYTQQRREIYVKFLRSVSDTRWANMAVWDEARRTRSGEGDEQDSKDRMDRLAKRAEEAAGQLADIEAELEVVASNDVLEKATKLVRLLPDGGGIEYAPARQAFLRAVRRELGVAEYLP